MFDAIGDRCKYWLTFNEPWIISAFGYNVGVFAPGRSSDRKTSPEGDSATEVSQNSVHAYESWMRGVQMLRHIALQCWIVAHSLIISHARAVKAYREEYKAKSPGGKGMIGITVRT